METNGNSESDITFLKINYETIFKEVNTKIKKHKLLDKGINLIDRLYIKNLKKIRASKSYQGMRTLLLKVRDSIFWYLIIGLLVLKINQWIPVESQLEGLLLSSVYIIILQKCIFFIRKVLILVFYIIIGITAMKTAIYLCKKTIFWIKTVFSEPETESIKPS